MLAFTTVLACCARSRAPAGKTDVALTRSTRVGPYAFGICAHALSMHHLGLDAIDDESGRAGRTRIVPWRIDHRGLRPPPPCRLLIAPPHRHPAEADRKSGDAKRPLGPRKSGAVRADRRAQPGKRAIHGVRVFGGLGQRSDRVECPGQREDTLGAEHAIGRFETHRSADRGGDANAARRYRTPSPQSRNRPTPPPPSHRTNRPESGSDPRGCAPGG